MREYKSGTYTQLPSGKWRGRISTPDGRRISATRDTEKECRAELRRLAGKVASGAPVASTNHTVKSWLAVWLEESRPNLAPRTAYSYASYIALYINPVIGKQRLTALRPEHVNKMVRAITDQGLSPATALKCRAVLRRSLTVAQRYGHVAVNVATLTDAPKQVAPVRPWLTAGQAKAVLAASADDRMRARYWVALYLGLRQGELLGLRWVDLDLDAGTLTVRQAAQRLTWQHGCQAARPEPGKAACGHKRGADCPQRHGGGITAKAPKSDAGRRVIPLPPVLATELRGHRKRQAAERLHAGSHWQDHGLVFSQPGGSPIDQAADLAAWHTALKRAGVPAMGTHAARRTAATLLLEAGVDAKTVSVIIGHSSVQLTMNVYQQSGLAIMRDGTDRIAAILAPAEPAPAVTPIRAPRPSLMGLLDARKALGLRTPGELRALIDQGEIETVTRNGREMVTEASLDAFYRAVQEELG